MGAEPLSHLASVDDYLRGHVRAPSEWERLDSLPVERLAELIEERLRGRGEARPASESRAEQPEDLFIAEYDRAGRAEVRGRFRDAIAALVHEWCSPLRSGDASRDAPYLSRLIRLCDRLQVREANGFLVALALDKRSSGWRTPYDRDVRSQILRALQFNQLEHDGTVGSDRDMVSFWLTYLRNPRYTAVAFRGLYIAAPHEGAARAGDVAEICHRNPDFMDLSAVLWLFAERCGEERLLSALRMAREKPAPVREFLRSAVDRLTGLRDAVREEAGASLSRGSDAYALFAPWLGIPGVSSVQTAKTPKLPVALATLIPSTRGSLSRIVSKRLARAPLTRSARTRLLGVTSSNPGEER